MKISNSNRLFPLFKNNRFYNNHIERPESLLFQTIPSFICSFYNRKKRLPENKNEWIVKQATLDSSIEPVITWIGHASFLIQLGGINILTDPVFGNVSPFFSRILPPGIPVSQIPRVDVVLLSHNHPDHCDVESLKSLKKYYPDLMLLVPKGDKEWLSKKGFKNILEHTWWDEYRLLRNVHSVTFTFLPAHHWSAKTLFDRNRSLWGSWMITHNDKSIYFAGDSAYADHFKHIALEYPHIQAALMPIAPGEPHAWMRKTHLDAQQAVHAFLDLEAKHFIPMHWGTFQFGNDNFADPLTRLKIAWERYAGPLQDKKLSILKFGQRTAI